MKIAIDLTQIPINKTGIGIYAVNLVREICKKNKDVQNWSFYFFFQEDDLEWQNFIEKKNQFRWISIKSKVFRKLILRFFFEQFILPIKCKKLGIDIIYSLHYTIPYFTRIKRVVMVPDMTFYLYPKLHQRIKRFYFKTLIPISIRKSNKIVTISESTKKDLINHFPGLTSDKIEVIHLGVGGKDKIMDHSLFKKENGAINHFENKSKKYFLYIGTLEPRKNIPAIIKAYHHLVKENPEFKKKYQLVIVGKKGWFYQEIFNLVSEYQLENDVIFTGYVEEHKKHLFLKNAFSFLYPSFYEGFGLPVLEAMSYKLPVITSNVSSLPEISGDAALLIDPHDWTEISASMLKLITNPLLYDQLTKKSEIQANLFTWEKTLNKTMKLFENI